MKAKRRESWIVGDGNRIQTEPNAAGGCTVIVSEHSIGDYRIRKRIVALPDMEEALRRLAEIGEAGIIEKRETGKQTWNALDAVADIARAALAKAGIE